MIIVDFMHLSYRNLFTCVYSGKYTKQYGKYLTEEFIGLYFHQMLQSLEKISKQFKDYGEIIIALDDYRNWRKEIINQYYKSNRKEERQKSDINFEEFFQYQNEFIDFISGIAKTIRVPYAEADDIAFVLSQLQEKTLLITSDKDWQQHMIDTNAKLYDPIKEQFIEKTQEELKIFRLKHILLGDKTDNIPHILYQTEFTKEFQSYLNKLKLDIKTPSELEEFIEKYGTEIIDNFNGEIYKTPRFGEKTAEKLIQNPKEFKKKIKDKKKVIKNFHINRQLIDLRKIPKEIKNNIIEVYNNSSIKEFNSEFMQKYSLKKAKDFEINGNSLIHKEFDDLYKDLF